jgi:uncharacterized NAD(P)/FAD-binding protein YdhS
MIQTRSGDDPTIVVIGGGAAGTLTAANLLAGCDPCRVVLVERTGRFGRGVAYGTTDPAHLLNVRAGAMGAHPARPGDFLRWIRRFDRSASAESFVPRRLFGDYLGDVLDAAERTGRGRTVLTRVHGTAVRLAPSPRGSGATVGLADGRRFAAGAVVLAVGSLPPADPPIPGLTSCRGVRYVRDPWTPGAIAGIGLDDSVLLLGTGLTAMDVALSLRRRGHRAVVHAVSRRGLLPQAHPRAHIRSLPAFPVPPGRLTLRRLHAAIRAEVKEAAARGLDWRGVVDSLRPRSVEIWRALPEPERRRFLRHGVRWWDVHRHRLAPEVADVIAAMRREGRLRVLAGRVLELRDGAGRASPISLRLRGQPDVARLRPSVVVNCTGPCLDPAGAGDHLIDDLLRRGLAVSDRLRLGFQVDDEGALLDASGRPSEILFTIGALRRGSLWETTAIPEIRAQAADLATRVTRLAAVRV